MNPVNDFGRVAKQLARNPLGIIALFIVLVYGIAALVFGNAAHALTPPERQPLIWFLVLFPVLVLGTFYFLVSRHHTKLYAPEDFRDADGFFRAMTPGESQQRLEADVKVEEELGGRVAASVGNLEHAEQTPKAELPVLEAYFLAETLALRKLELEFGLRVKRDVRIGNHFEADGVFISANETILVEIKFTRAPHWNRLVRLVLEKFSRIQTDLEISGKPLRFILVLVTDDLPAAVAKSELERTLKLVNSARDSIELRHYELRELMRGEKVGA